MRLSSIIIEFTYINIFISQFFFIYASLRVETGKSFPSSLAVPNAMASGRPYKAWTWSLGRSID